MGRRGRKGVYTPLGNKIMALSDNQKDLAMILNLTQQSISGKMTGKIAITMKDIEVLSKHFDVPFIYFFEDSVKTAEEARAWAQVLRAPQDLHHLIGLASKLPEPSLKQLFRTALAIKTTSDYYAEDWPQHDRDVFQPPPSGD